MVERLGRLGQRLGLARSVPRGLERLLRTPKYLLLAFFLVTVWFTMASCCVTLPPLQVRAKATRPSSMAEAVAKQTPGSLPAGVSLAR